MSKKEYVGNGIDITDEMRVLVAATASKLVFGLRDYQLRNVDRIIIYPEKFYSKTNDQYHIGEFNPYLKTLVFSWKDFKLGYEIENDNINLAVHEIVHAIHFNFLNRSNKSTSAAIFLGGFSNIIDYLEKNPIEKSKLIDSGYFRSYALTNQYEFLAVVVETFIESPSVFKSQFPTLYYKIRTMLNFRFSGY